MALDDQGKDGCRYRLRSLIHEEEKKKTTGSCVVGRGDLHIVAK
jgi:hypothetical protein